MTDRFKEAEYAIRNRVVWDNPEDDWKYLAITIAPYQNTILDALTLASEAEQLRKEVSELSTQKQGLIGISDGKSDIIKLLEYRIALLETFIESRGYDVPV